ncbi:MAG: hypothetical protein AAF631_11245 [Pseudomonadota bacterium]
MSRRAEDKIGALKMIGFMIADQEIDTHSSLLQGASDVAFAQFGDDWHVVVSAEADSAITVFDFDGTIGTQRDVQGYSSTSGIRTAWNLTLAQVDGQTVIIPATRYEDQVRIYEFDGALDGTAPGVGGLGLTHAVTLGDDTFVYAADLAGRGLDAYRLEGDLSMDEVATLSDTAETYLGDVRAMASASVDGTAMLFVASGYDAGLAAYSIGSNGRLTLGDTVAPGDESGFSRPAALETVTVGGQEFLVMASAGSSSLTVFRIATDGTLSEVDHLIDTLDTRFQGASELTSFDYEGRSFVVAAGSDDGISVLELRDGGRFWDYGALADTYETTLDNVSGLDARVIDGTPTILVSSDTDHGITQVELDMAGLEDVISGSEGNELLRGTSSADVIEGKGGNDRLEGRGGSDILVDGTGADMLTGDGGQDLFQFVADDNLDIITDYSVGYDRIDLSGYGGVRSIFDLVMYETCGSVMIEVGGDRILIQGSEDDPYAVADFTGSDFLF